MNDGWRAVVLGEVAEIDIERVSVRPTGEYSIAGVLNAGQGLFDRGRLRGAGTDYSAFHRLRVGQLVMRKLTAWEGPIAVVVPEFDGYCVSTEFPTFRLDERRILPEFIRFVCQDPSFWAALKNRSTGTVQRRKRVNPSALLTIPILLPPLKQQRRIVDLVASIDNLKDSVDLAISGYRRLAQQLRREHFSTVEGGSIPAGEFFEITMGRQRSPGNATGEHMIPYLRAANVKDGWLDLADVKSMNFTPVEQTRYCLLSGDVLVTEGCGSLKQLGASARWSGEIGGPICFQNTLLRVRARPGSSTERYAYQWARHSFESRAFARIASGTNIFHIGAERAAAMQVTSISTQLQEQFANTVQAADDAVLAGRRLLDCVVAIRRPLLADLLTGQQVISDTYDQLLKASG